MENLEIFLIVITSIAFLVFVLMLINMLKYKHIIKRCSERTLGVIKDFESKTCASDGDPYLTPVFEYVVDDLRYERTPFIDKHYAEKVKIDDAYAIAYDPANPGFSYVVNKYTYNHASIKLFGLMVILFIILTCIVIFAI